MVIKHTYNRSKTRCDFFKELKREDELPSDLLDEFGQCIPTPVAWVPPYDYYDGSEFFWTKFENNETAFIYCVCLYYSVLVIGGNELGPKETIELIYVVAINLIGAIVNAYIFGELAVLIAQMGRKLNRYQHVYDTANTAMTNIKLPETLKSEIRTYFKKVQNTMSQQHELNEFFAQISPSLKLEVQSHMFERSLIKNTTILQAKELILKSKESPVS